MQESKLLKISWIILAVGIVGGIVITVASIINPLLTDYVFESYTGQDWNEFTEQYPKHAALYEHYSKLGNSHSLVAYIYALFIVFASYRKGAKWAWVALLLATILGSGSVVRFEATFSGGVGLGFGTIGLCVGLVALLIPAKEIWKAKPEETG